MGSKIIPVLLSFFLFSAIASLAYCQPNVNGYDIQLKVKNQYIGDDSFIIWKMNLINKNVYVRKRVLARYMKETGGLKKILLRFWEPADIRNTALLTWENKDADDTQFLYLPAMKKTRRIASVDKEQSFVGTDFNFEDMGNLKVDDYVYSNVVTKVIDGQECYYYEAVAKPNSSTVYSRMNTWTSKESLIRIRVEYFDKQGKLFKIGIAKDIRKVDGIWTPFYVSMENLEDKHKTEIIIEKVKYNIGLPDDLFGLVNLETGSFENF